MTVLYRRYTSPQLQATCSSWNLVAPACKVEADLVQRVYCCGVQGLVFGAIRVVVVSVGCKTAVAVGNKTSVLPGGIPAIEGRHSLGAPLHFVPHISGCSQVAELDSASD